ncbi:MAG: HD domain-containing protein [Lachnospiraceae bacterium]|nr:HD domain-containing protein [Lachnospiraceae bacterium]
MEQEKKRRLFKRHGQKHIAKPINRYIWTRISFSVGAILVNLLLAWLASILHLPLYLDMVGTVFVSMIGGSFSGLIVAVLTCILITPINHIGLYFSLVSVMIALTTAWFVRRKLVDRPSSIPVLILVLALISGVFGTCFQWLLLGEPQFEEVRQTAQMMAGDSAAGYFFCSMLLSVGLNLFDKGISVGLALLARHFVPKHVREGIWNSGWRQKPLGEAEIREINRQSADMGRSLRFRMAVMVLMSTLLVSVVLIRISLSVDSQKQRDEHLIIAESTAVMVKQYVDPDLVDAYLRSELPAQECTLEGYQEARKMIRNLVDSYDAVSEIHVVQYRNERSYVIFSSLPEETEPVVLGSGVPLEVNEEYIYDQLEVGETPPMVSVEYAGQTYLLDYSPFYNESGQCKGYVVVSIAEGATLGFEKEYLTRTLLVFLGFFVLILGYELWEVGHYLIYPIGSLSLAAEGFLTGIEDQEQLDANVRRIRKLNIHTGDELEKLYKAICEMASGTAEQVRSIRHFAEATARMQNGLIVTMADMVENRDSDTGAHIQKTAAYVKIIAEGLKKHGYYAEKLTPQYIANVVMSAPLHDVGKINIPDAVLNKPGKLTEEEFEIMKTHTTHGKRIMDQAINTVGGENYLKEARNMAAFHHERWDGKGYPEGLHGQVIPLSARIMAVADVFDALTSPRVYKPAFPLEKAVQILEEGAGTQFDPKCVEVFLDEMPEVKKVLKKYQRV